MAGKVINMGAGMLPTGPAAAAIDGVAADLASQATKDNGPEDQFWTVKGVKLQLKKFPGYLSLEAGRRIKRPEVPEIYDEAKLRNIRNDQDPEYIAELADYNLTVGMLQTTVNLGFGTELLELPKGMDGPDDDGWAEDLMDIAGIEVEAKGRKSRYVSWLLTVAFTDDIERLNCMTKVLQYGSGVTEEAVENAAAGFPSSVPGESDNGTGESTGATVGNNGLDNGSGGS